MNDQVQIGRLAMRQEGGFWVAYYAHPKTMELAEELGRIAMAAIVNHPERKDAFMRMMREVVGDILEGITGVRPIWWEPIPGPAKASGPAVNLADDRWDEPNRRPVEESPPARHCMTCDGFGWAAWDRRIATSKAISTVEMLLRCPVCNKDGHLGKPTPAAARAILDGWDL